MNYFDHVRYILNFMRNLRFVCASLLMYHTRNKVKLYIIPYFLHLQYFSSILPYLHCFISSNKSKNIFNNQIFSPDLIRIRVWYVTFVSSILLNSFCNILYLLHCPSSSFIQSKFVKRIRPSVSFLISITCNLHWLGVVQRRKDLIQNNLCHYNQTLLLKNCQMTSKI